MRNMYTSLANNVSLCRYTPWSDGGYYKLIGSNLFTFQDVSFAKWRS